MQDGRFCAAFDPSVGSANCNVPGRCSKLYLKTRKEISAGELLELGSPMPFSEPFSGSVCEFACPCSQPGLRPERELVSV